jgi:hypothetical protein
VPIRDYLNGCFANYGSTVPPFVTWVSVLLYPAWPSKTLIRSVMICLGERFLATTRWLKVFALYRQYYQQVKSDW